MARGIDQIRELEKRVGKIEFNLGGWPALLKDEEASARSREEELQRDVNDALHEQRVAITDMANRLIVVEAWAERTTRQLEVLEGPPPFEIRWMEEEKEILLAALAYHDLWDPIVGFTGGEEEAAAYKRFLGACEAYKAMQSKHDPPEKEKEDE